MIQLRIHQDGDDVFLTWHLDQRIADCRGFAIHRRRNGTEDVLPSYAGFAKENWTAGDHKPSNEWPVQKFWWSDYAVQEDDVVRYRIVPVVRDATSASSLAATPIRRDRRGS